MSAAIQTKTGYYFTLAGVISSVCAFGVSQGLSYPLLAIVMKRNGGSDFLIGLMSAAAMVSLLVSPPLIIWLARRFGAWNVAVAGLVGTAGCIFAFGLTGNFIAWFLLRFALGGFIATPYIIGETWINELATPTNRGRVLGAYGAMMAASFALGPLIIALFGTQGLTPFALGAAASLLAILPLLAARGRVPDFAGKGRARTLDFLRAAPMLLLAVAAFALFDQVGWTFIPIYLASGGFSVPAAAMVIFATIVGGIAFQLPLGLLVDRFGAARLLPVCAGGITLGAVILPFILAFPVAVYVVAFAWGGIANGLYMTALAELGGRFNGSSLLLAGNAAFAVAWGVGGLVGPPIIGAGLNVFGATAFPVLLAIMFAVTTIALLPRR